MTITAIKEPQTAAQIAAEINRRIRELPDPFIDCRNCTVDSVTRFDNPFPSGPNWTTTPSAPDRICRDQIVLIVEDLQRRIRYVD